MATAESIAFGEKNGLPLKPNEQSLEHFLRFKQDITQPIAHVHKPFVRFDMLDELKAVRNQKGAGWKNAHQSFDPIGPCKRAEKIAREIAAEKKLLRPRVYTPPKKSTIPRWLLTNLPDYSEPDPKLERKGKLLDRQIEAAQQKLQASKRKTELTKKKREAGEPVQGKPCDTWDAPPIQDMVTEYSAMLYGRSIKLADELGLRPTGNTREMQDDFEFRKQMIKQKALIRPV